MSAAALLQTAQRSDRGGSEGGVRVERQPAL